MAHKGLVLTLLLTACVEVSVPLDDQPPAAALSQKSERPRAVEVRTARAQIRAMLDRKLPLPKRARSSSCTDLGRLSETERELSLRVVDDRYDTRSVLPLSITRHLTQPDLNQLESILAGVDRPEQARSALQSAARAAKRRFVGAYHVIHYVSPKWVVRAGSLKPSWEAGRLDGWFVVHDAETGEARCAARVTINGDATGASRRIRLRSETRDKLTTALGERTRAATADALRRIAPELGMPRG